MKFHRSTHLSQLDKELKARYLRLETSPTSPVPFHLQHLEVWGLDPSAK